MIASRRGLQWTIRLAAAIAALPLGAAVARADIAIVQQDRTPIVSAPGVGGRILTRVDAGFTFIVVGRNGDWLQVESPQLNLTGTLWVPVGRMGDVIAMPTEAMPAASAPMTAAEPQFRITSAVTGDATSSAGVPVLSRGSTGVSAAAARTASLGTTGTTRATGGATTAAATTSAVTDEGNPTPPVGNSGQPLGNPTPPVGNSGQPLGNPTAPLGNSGQPLGNPTPAVSGNPTTAVSSNPTPALGSPVGSFGNPTPALGNPTPAMANSTPAMGNTTVGIGFKN